MSRKNPGRRKKKNRKYIESIGKKKLKTLFSLQENKKPKMKKMKLARFGSKGLLATSIQKEKKEESKENILKLVYWEDQYAKRCGLHSINTLFQGQVCTFDEFQEYAQKKWDEEQKFYITPLAEAKNKSNQELIISPDPTVKTVEEETKTKPRGVDRVLPISYFDPETGESEITTIISWVQKYFPNSKVDYVGAEEDIRLITPLPTAFIINLKGKHFYTIRQFSDGKWVDLNSLSRNGPVEVTLDYVQELNERKQITVFYVIGLAKAEYFNKLQEKKYNENLYFDENGNFAGYKQVTQLLRPRRVTGIRKQYWGQIEKERKKTKEAAKKAKKKAKAKATTKQKPRPKRRK